MNNLMLKNDDSRPELDDLLHDYFQTEMPRHWPSFKAPRQKATLSLWARSGSRMALAACIALLVGGYLAIGGSFTKPDAAGLHHAGPGIGSKEKSDKADLSKMPKVEDGPKVFGEMP